MKLDIKRQYNSINEYIGNCEQHAILLTQTTKKQEFLGIFISK